MLFIAITKVGLHARDEGSFLNKALLLQKFSFSGFFQKCKLGAIHSPQNNKNLFPKINHCDVANLTNTMRGMAIVCAADDLELSLGGENGQIEIFDNFVPTNPSKFYHDQMQLGVGKNALNSAHFPNFDKRVNSDLDLSYHSSHFGMEDYSPTLLSSGHSQIMRFPFEHPQLNRHSPERNFPQVHGNDFPEFGMDFMAAHQSHFDIMASGVQLETHFTDFKRGSFNDALSCGSSIDTFDSPLDEMFMSRHSSLPNGNLSHEPAPSFRKRKPESQLEPEFPGSTEIFFKTEPISYEGQKKIKRESVGQFEPPRSHVLDFPKPHSDILFRPQNLAFTQEAPSGEQDNIIKVEEDKGKARYTCSECNAAFKVKSYLTRHIRKHNNAKAFVCPFYREQDSEYCGTSKAGTKCHPTGGFSRKDTYKTHLKALHFIYPPRTKSSERGTQGGRCAGCFQYFESNADWFKYHIEDGACKGFVNKTGVQVKQEMQD